MSPDLKAWQR